MATTVSPVGGAAGGLPPGVALGDLAEAVLRSRSWRGVLRCLGLTSPSTGRRLRAACDAEGLDHRHFSGNQHGTRDLEALRRAVAESATWAEVADRVGYASTSGSARSAVRRQAAAAGLDVLHLQATAASPGQVKSGTHRAPSGSWAVWITRGGRGTSRPYSAEEVDVFGIVDGDRAVYLIPVDVVQGQTCVYLRAYDRFRLAWTVQGAAEAPAARDEGSADLQRTPRTTSG